MSAGCVNNLRCTCCLGKPVLLSPSAWAGPGRELAEQCLGGRRVGRGERRPALGLLAPVACWAGGQGEHQTCMKTDEKQMKTLFACHVRDNVTRGLSSLRRRRVPDDWASHPKFFPLNHLPVAFSFGAMLALVSPCFAAMGHVKRAI